MDFEKTLPEDFMGTFYFTNWTDEDFIGLWGKKEYIFPAQTTSPMLMPEYTLLEVQQIRKKFALDLAQKASTGTEEWKKNFAREIDPQGMRRLSSLHQAGSLSPKELEPLIKKCLEPLPMGKAKVKEVPFVPIEDRISKDEHGEINTVSLGQKDDIVTELRNTHEKMRRKNNL